MTSYVRRNTRRKGFGTILRTLFLDEFQTMQVEPSGSWSKESPGRRKFFQHGSVMVEDIGTEYMRVCKI